MKVGVHIHSGTVYIPALPLRNRMGCCEAERDFNGNFVRFEYLTHSPRMSQQVVIITIYGHMCYN